MRIKVHAPLNAKLDSLFRWLDQESVCQVSLTRVLGGWEFVFDFDAFWLYDVDQLKKIIEDESRCFDLEFEEMDDSYESVPIVPNSAST